MPAANPLEKKSVVLLHLFSVLPVALPWLHRRPVVVVVVLAFIVVVVVVVVVVVCAFCNRAHF